MPLVQQKPKSMINVAFWACGDFFTEARNVPENLVFCLKLASDALSTVP